MGFLRKANEGTLVIEDEPIPAAEIAAKVATAQPVKPSPAPTARPAAANSEAGSPLLPASIVEEMKKGWAEAQISFVDEPRAAVKQCDELVASAIKRLTESCEEAKKGLETALNRGGDNTDELRVAFKKYRTFFQKLMSL